MNNPPQSEGHPAADPAAKQSARAMCLVIGYGNELRQDDGLGPKLARRIEEQAFAGVEVVIAHQLTPDLAARLSSVRKVVFIDAGRPGVNTVQLERIYPLPRGPLRAHQSDPATLLRTAAELFGAWPHAWMMTLPTASFDFGETLSEVGQSALDLGYASFCEWVQSQEDLRSR